MAFIAVVTLILPSRCCALGRRFRRSVVRTTCPILIAQTNIECRPAPVNCARRCLAC